MQRWIPAVADIFPSHDKGADLRYEVTLRPPNTPCDPLPVIITRVILVNMEISVILGHEKTKIKNILDLGKIDVFSVRTNIYIKNKKMGHLI